MLIFNLYKTQQRRLLVSAASRTEAIGFTCCQLQHFQPGFLRCGKHSSLQINQRYLLHWATFVQVIRGDEKDLGFEVSTGESFVAQVDLQTSC